MRSHTLSTDIEVRFRDTDSMGHVNNAVYLTYLEVGRQAYWKRCVPDVNYARVPFVLARVEIDFRSPAVVGDTVRVHLSTHWVGRSSFGMIYTLEEPHSGRVLAEAETVQVTFEYAAHRAMPVPDDLREKFERFEGRRLPARASES